MAEVNKRPAEEGASSHRQKRQKSDGSRKWQWKWKGGASKVVQIESGNTGVFATCFRGKEGKYVRELHPTESGHDAEDQAESEEDIEAEIRAEVDKAKTSDKSNLLETIRTDMECVVFCRATPPVHVESLVHRVCCDAQQGVQPQQSRFLKRLTPITLVAKATENGLAELAKAVLAPHFHQEGQTPKKFAIRTTIRNSSSLERDAIIEQVARAVGPSHSVDLKGYDLLILVDVWKNLCGMAVVGSDYESLKRFNLAELHAPALPRSPPEASA